MQADLKSFGKTQPSRYALGLPLFAGALVIITLHPIPTILSNILYLTPRLLCIFVYFDIHGNSKLYIEPCLTRGTSTRARLMSVTNRKMRYACKHMGIKLLSFFHAVNADSCHDSNFVVIGGTWLSKPCHDENLNVGCQNDKATSG